MNHVDEYEARLRALGEVVTTHAHCEALVYTAFMDYSAIDADRLRIIQEHGRVKVADMPKIIKAFIEHFPSDDAEADQRVQDALKEFDRLTQQRNKFVHWQWGVGVAGVPSISDITKQRVGGDIRSESFDLEELHTLANRLQAIIGVLAVNLPSTRGVIPKHIREAFSAASTAAK
ncbi:hypothetical protein EPIRMAN_GEN20615_19100 [Ralstonia mannitolilytica]|uniref:hypothetical protein n=1 Tax=Ralstonia mannitolilytica TaxID=105219 RepID=UPI0005D927EF|nr:hypothetical protein [Ralstonia mannitolilytica]AJW45490.1 hypothetical protein TK49_12710 [Ralstonia mannitolilytica]QIF07696.1 hypothetical protein G5A69_08425 [Ralstonia mannitolilytica]CAJ0783589.1 hypothetical protein R77555_01094 [Ralstonia mannitolilytica]